MPTGANGPAPLAPGRLASIYGQHLGPAKPCTGTPDPQVRQKPNPGRPNQTIVETLRFPKKLCDVEVRLNDLVAGLLYTSATQINFQVPQELPLQGSAVLQVFYRGQAGPKVPVGLENATPAVPAGQLAEQMLRGLDRVPWTQVYKRSSGACTYLPVHPNLRRGLLDYASYCMELRGEVISEALYYPLGEVEPANRLMRADFRLVNGYPELSAEVEDLVAAKLSARYGPGSTPERSFEIGVSKPAPGRVWMTGDLTIFLHRNRTHLPIVGVREGVQIIAVRNEVLREREKVRSAERAMQSRSRLSHAVLQMDVNRKLGGEFLGPTSVDDVRRNLMRTLRWDRTADPDTRAAALVAADALTVQLGQVLLAQSPANGVEIMATANRQLVPLGVRYTGVGHYSGALEYDRSLLSKAWEHYPDTAWGQRAFLLLQSLACSIPNPECKQPNCFRTVIRNAETFLTKYPAGELRLEALHQLGQAYETMWSLSKAGKDDLTTQGSDVSAAEGEQAHVRALEIYDQLIRLAPESPEGQTARLSLPRLKLKLDTGERRFFCFHC